MSLDWKTDKHKVDPTLAKDLDDLLGYSDFDWAIYRGWASSKVQEELYRRYLGGGPLASKPGHSAHECEDSEGYPCALAVDVARVDARGQLLWDYESNRAWPWLWQACKDHSRLHSGHYFPDDTNGRVGRDDDHIQAISWYKYKARLVLAGRW